MQNSRIALSLSPSLCVSLLSHCLIFFSSVLTPSLISLSRCITHSSIIGRSFHKCYFCRDNVFVKTNNFVLAKVLLWQAYFCRNKNIKTCFVATEIILVAAPTSDASLLSPSLLSPSLCFLYVISFACPEVTLWGWQDVKIQLLTLTLLHPHPTPIPLKIKNTRVLITCPTLT